MTSLLQGPWSELLEWPPSQNYKRAATAEVADKFVLRSGDRRLGRAGVHSRGTWKASVTAEVITSTGLQ